MHARLNIRRLLALYSSKRLSQLSSGERTKRSLSVLLKPLFAREAADLTAADVSAAVERVATTAPTHANRCLGYLRPFFAWAEDEGLIECNPARDVQMPAPEVARHRVLTLEEIVDVWRSAEVLGYPFGPAIRLMILTGMLREDVGAMRRSDIDFGEFGRLGAWRLPAHPNDYAKVFVVALADLARRELIEALGRRSRRGDYVFTTTGKSPISGWSRAKNRLDVEIARRRKDAHLPPMQEWRLNDLRRSLVMNVQDLFGIDPALANSCLHVQSGFSSVNTREIAYSGLIDGFRAEVLTAWARVIDEATRCGVSLEQVRSRLERELSYYSLPGRAAAYWEVPGEVAREWKLSGKKRRPVKS